MTKNDRTPPKTRLFAARARLITWLTSSAYPLWASNGIDAQNGGFIETLAQNGIGLSHPRRARVQPRQIYAFAQAARLGWPGDATGIIERGAAYFTRYYLRADGLFRTVAAADGSPLDERALLYDQAFALLGYAAAAVALDSRPGFEARAIELRNAVDSTFRSSSGAFRSAEAADGPIESNPHMHLLEACLAWAEIGDDPTWADWVHGLVQLATTRFIHRSGALGEFFTADLQPAPGIAGRIIEPGHQFEWAWLLLRSEGRYPKPLREVALRLVAIGEDSGVHDQFAINSLLDDLSVHDANARFWPQTERLKAALLAAQLTNDDKYWAMAAAAADSLFPYLNTPVQGLWLDVRMPNGDMLDAPAPASSFYHLVGAIVALDAALPRR